MYHKLILLLGVLSIIVSNRSEAAVVPPEIEAALKSNAAQLEGLRIRGTYQRKLLGNAQESLKLLGTLESAAEFSELVRFDLKLSGNRLNEQLRYPPSQYNPPDSVNARAFDAEKFYSGSAYPNNGDSPGVLTIHTPTTLIEDERTFGSYGRLFELWYLRAAGFQGPQASARLGEQIQSLVLDSIANGSLLSSGPGEWNGKKTYEVNVRVADPWGSKSRSEIDADPSFLYRGESRDLQQKIEVERRSMAGAARIVRFTLDPAMNYAVVRIDERRGAGDKPMFLTENSDFVDLGQGLWLPKTSQITSSAYETRPAFSSDRPTYITRISIDEINRQKFRDEDFQVWFDVPGVGVEDFTHSKAQPGRPFQFVVASNIDKLASSGRLIRSIVIGINVVVLVALIVLVVRKSLQAET